MANFIYNCEVCRFFQYTERELEIGECRKHSPLVHISKGGLTERKFPPVIPDEDWCGDFVYDSFAKDRIGK